MDLFKYGIISVIWLFSFAEIKARDTQPDTVLIGAFISSLHDFDIDKGTIGSDIHLWCLYTDTSYDFQHQLEYVNTENIVLAGTSVVDLSDKKWFYTKALIRSRQKFSTKNYPFDEQRIIFIIESSEYTTDNLVFLTDSANCIFDSMVFDQIEGWVIQDISFQSTDVQYASSFGDPATTLSSSPRFIISFTLKRTQSWLALFKVITGIIVAFIISTCVFFIKPTHTDPRFGLCVGGLFAAIGNKYIVESMIASTNELNLLDNLHNITFIAILLIVIISVLSLRLYEINDGKYQRISEKIDRLSFYSIMVSYVSLFVFFIWLYQ